MNDDKTYDPTKHEILRVLVGSQMHGTGDPAGEDTDIMALVIEPKWMVFSSYNFETKQIRTQPEGVRSGPGDTDYVAHTLRKWIRLAAKGNPTILLPLFVPNDHVGLQHVTMEGDTLRQNRGLFITKSAGAQHLGYMTAQRSRLTGERGGKHTNRPELIERYGYDTKYAMHMLRLGYQGLELMTKGTVTLPVAEPYLSTLVSVRKGLKSLDDCLAIQAYLEGELEQAITKADLPVHPDPVVVGKLCADLYESYWAWRAPVVSAESR
jgi:uncharacterized protein